MQPALPINPSPKIDPEMGRRFASFAAATVAGASVFRVSLASSLAHELTFFFRPTPVIGAEPSAKIEHSRRQRCLGCHSAEAVEALHSCKVFCGNPLFDIIDGELDYLGGQLGHRGCHVAIGHILRMV